MPNEQKDDIHSSQNPLNIVLNKGESKRSAERPLFLEPLIIRLKDSSSRQSTTSSQSTPRHVR